MEILELIGFLYTTEGKEKEKRTDAWLNLLSAASATFH